MILFYVYMVSLMEYQPLLGYLMSKSVLVFYAIIWFQVTNDDNHL